MAWRRTAALAAGLCGLAASLITGAVRAGEPQRGDVQKLQVITLALQVGNLEKESRQVTYTPPPGWYVRSHVVDCIRKYGNSSYTVATVPQNWGWLSEEKIAESYKVLIELAAKAKDAGLEAKFVHDRDAMLTELHKVRSTHHALVVEATARGEGWLRGGGGLQLTVTAELVYVGTAEDLGRTVEHHRAQLK